MLSMKTVLIALTLLGLVAGRCAGADAKRPNLLFIIVDDQSALDLKVYNGQSQLQTPNIDRLAAEGLRFEQFYVNSPICSPSRVAISTGQYPGESEPPAMITPFFKSVLKGNALVSRFSPRQSRIASPT
jgi:hypothetical protein